MRFLITWLLCAVAFAIPNQPSDAMTTLKIVVAGVLVAIAICLVPEAVGHFP